MYMYLQTDLEGGVGLCHVNVVPLSDVIQHQKLETNNNNSCRMQVFQETSLSLSHSLSLSLSLFELCPQANHCM